MALTITPDSINAIYESGLSDAELQSMIDAYENYETRYGKLGECLSSANGDVIGGIILANYIISIIYNPSGDIKSMKGSFGGSVTYSENALGGNYYLQRAQTMDTGNCLVALQKVPLGMCTVGVDA